MTTQRIDRICLTIIIWAIQHFVIVNGMDGRIVGGSYANISDFPHMVLIAVYCKHGATCGANIVNQRLLLTAAHCLELCSLKHKRDSIEAYAGSSDINKMKELRKMVNFKMHEDYDPNRDPFDIGLIWVNKPFSLGDTMKRVIIKRSFPKGVTGHTAGWGFIDDYDSVTDHLKRVDQIVKSNKYCITKGSVYAGTMCATSANPRNYIAGGDSGSGLMYRKQVIGVVSYRYSRHYETTFYANVSYFYNWIVATAPKLACST